MRDNELNQPAYPVASVADLQFTGMSLRDYFAAAALQGMLANEALISRIETVANSDHLDSQVLLATAAFGAADAMLQERAK